MRAVVYRGPNDLRLETVPVPRIGPGELLVQVAACGVCPTDIKKIQHGTVPPPRIFGHETAGVISRLGPGVSDLGWKIGDRVALHHHVPCLDCHFCRHHAFAQCATYKRTGITAGFEPAGGGYAEYVRVMPFVLPGVVKIPAKNSFAEGAMLEPVNTVLKAVRRLSLLSGDVVLVAGQGPIGLMFTRLLQLAGARVIAADLLASRLKLAKKFGAKWTINASSNQPKASVGAEITRRESNPHLSTTRRVEAERRRLLHRATRGRGLDAAIVTVPSDDVVRQALAWLRGGGQLMIFAHTRRSTDDLSRRCETKMVSKMDKRADPFSLSAAGGGEGRGEVASSPLNHPARRGGTKAAQPPVLRSLGEGGSAFSLDLSSICVDEKDLLGSYSSDFMLQNEVARLVFSRQLDVRPLISHRFPLEQTAAAVALASRPSPDSLKILVAQVP
jgi:L-iditol 2-dehydrogenase